jgi:pyruvate dehydrogenase E1 component alpha subunit
MTLQAEQVSIPTDKLIHMYRLMYTIRMFETNAIDLFQEGMIRGTTHTYIGMEAVGVGACAALEPDDYITSTHRGHGHCISKGGRLDLMMAELMGRVDGYCRGKGGSMHIADVDRGILGANGIVGGGMGIATGAALASQIKGTNQVAICFFGDGGLNQGNLYECANIASLWKLPVVYLCENNHYAMATSIDRATSVASDPAVRARAWNIPGVNVDGMDVLAVYEAASEAVNRARDGRGPSLLVCDTYRFEGHNVGDPLNYRTDEEVDSWRKKDAIERFVAYLTEQEEVSDDHLATIRKEVEAGIEEAIAFGRSSPEPSLDTLMEDIYA